MPSLDPSIVAAVSVSNIQAKGGALLHGWTPEPDGRGTWSILWSCLATIFICTWSVLHMDVPTYHGQSFLFLRRLKRMFIAVVAPEVLLYASAESFFHARSLLKELNQRGGQDWTVTHTQFACTDGFWVRTPQGAGEACFPEELRTLVENGNLVHPPISAEELTSRGKSDWIVKLVALIQIIWFVVQTLFRAIRHYHITALKIMTVASVFCSIVTYGFYWHLPQNIDYPVFVDIQDTAPIPVSTAQNGSTDESNCLELGAKSTPLINQATKPHPDHYDLALLLMVGFGCGFGAIHCLAWNSTFPTFEEGLAWRVCSASTTALPAVMLASEPFFTHYLWNSDSWELRFYQLCGLYVVGRITIIVLAFISLRALPADAFQTVNWNSYIPHFST